MKNNIQLLFCLSIFSLLYLLVVTFPGHYRAIYPASLDESWAYALNYLANSKYLFGRDIVFTFGPLGYLIAPRHIGPNLIYGISFMLIVHSLWAGILVTYLRATGHKSQFLLFILCFTLTCALGLWYEYKLLLTVLLLCCLPSKLDKPIIWPGIMAGILVPIFLMIRFNLGCGCLVMIILAFLSWKLEFASKANRLILATCISLVTSFAIASAICFKSTNNMWSWLVGSWEITKGYNESMSLLDNAAAPGYGFLLLTALITATIIFIRKKTQIGYLALIAIGSIMVSFKHSFVRQDPYHETVFFLFCLAAISIIGLSCRNIKTAYYCFASFGIFCLLSLYTLSHSGLKLDNIISFVNTAQGQSNIQCLSDMDSVGKVLDRCSNENYKQYQLPGDLIEYIKKSGNPPIATLPVCIGYTAANQLCWDPLPVMQLHMAYTPYLDKLCADHFNSINAPRFILWGLTADQVNEFGEVDNRNPILEAPLTTLAILNNYQIDKAYKDRNILLLRHRSTKQSVVLKPIGQKFYALNGLIPVPKSSSPILGMIILQPRLLLDLYSKVYQLPAVNINLYSAGRSQSYRLVCANLSTGLLLNYCPKNISELSQFLAGRNSESVQSIQICGPGCKLFNRQVEIKWLKLID